MRSAPSDVVCAPNTLDRAFAVSQPNRVWASDITCFRTFEGWLYLAVLIDLFSRRVVGWSIRSSRTPHRRTGSQAKNRRA